MRNGLIIQWKLSAKTQTVTFPIDFTTKDYFAIGVSYNNGSGMYNAVYESQIFPHSYNYGSVTFQDSTDFSRRVFAIGY